MDDRMMNNVDNGAACPIHLEPATPADIVSLMHMHAEAFADDEVEYGKGPPGYRDLECHRDMLAQNSYFKILSGMDLAGGIVVVDEGDGHYYLDKLFIDPRFHNRGFGQHALRRMEQAFPLATRWTLVTPYRNYRNHHFYEKMGYRKIAEKFVTGQPGLEKGFCLFVYEKLI